MNNQLDTDSKSYKNKINRNQSQSRRKQKPATAVKVAAARRMLADGKTVEQVRIEIGYKTRQGTIEFLRDNDVEIPNYVPNSKEESDRHWFAGKADPSGLTEDELRRCAFLDIKPERWAWLKTMPSGGITKFEYKNKE